MINVIKENLERIFNSIIHHKKEGNFLMLELDYIEYIGKNELLGKITKEIIREEKISIKFLEEMFNLFMIIVACRDFKTCNSKKESSLVSPTFTDKEIDKKYNLRKKFKEFLINEYNEFKEAKKIAGNRSVSEATDFFDHSWKDDIIDDSSLLHIQQLHNNLMAKLSEIEIKKALNKKRKTIKNSKASYKGGILYIKNKKISFSSKPNQRNLLNTLFKHPENIWDNDEIWEDWGEQDLIGKTLKFYTASDEINKKIAIETGLKDFLIKSTMQIQINPKYL